MNIGIIGNSFANKTITGTYLLLESSYRYTIFLDKFINSVYHLKNY